MGVVFVGDVERARVSPARKTLGTSTLSRKYLRLNDCKLPPRWQCKAKSLLANLARKNVIRSWRLMLGWPRDWFHKKSTRRTSSCEPDASYTKVKSHVGRRAGEDIHKIEYIMYAWRSSSRFGNFRKDFLAIAPVIIRSRRAAKCSVQKIRTDSENQVQKHFQIVEGGIT